MISFKNAFGVTEVSMKVYNYFKRETPSYFRNKKAHMTMTAVFKHIHPWN